MDEFPGDSPPYIFYIVYISYKSFVSYYKKYQTLLYPKKEKEDLMIVKGVKYFFSKVSWWQKVPFGEELKEGINNGDIQELLAEDKEGKKCVCKK